MERTLTIMLIAMTLSTAARGQDLFVEAHGTYLLPIGGIGTDNTTTNQSMSSYSTTSTSVLLNFGRGIGGGLVFGGDISDMLGLELRLSYVAGPEQDYSYRYSSSNSTDVHNYSAQSTYLSASPSIRIHGADTRFPWYMAIGPTFALAPRTTISENSSQTYPYAVDPGALASRTVVGKTEYEGRMGMGGTAAIGFLSQGDGVIGFFAELNCTALSWAPASSKTRETTTLTNVDGSSFTNTTTSETEYVQEVPANASDKTTKIHLPMSTWGLRAGIRYTFGRREKTDRGQQ